MAAPRIIRQRAHGATILTLEDMSFPLVRFLFAFRRGAAWDAPGHSGALRVAMDMLLRGTTERSRRDFNAALEELGSSVDTSVGSDLSVLRGVSLKRFVTPTMELVREAILSPAFDDDELERLRDEACDALIAERDDDDAVADYFLRRALYENHPLGRCPAGEVPELATLDRAAMTAAHADLATEDLVIAFAGAITPDEALAQVAPILAAMPQKATQRRALPALPEPRGLQIYLVDKPDRTQVQLRLARLSIDGRHPDVDAFWLGITAFGGTFTSPLTREVRDVRGWSYTAHADFRRRALFASPMIMRSAPAVSDAVDCLALEIDLYRALARAELEPDALTLARDYLLNRFPFEVATAFDMLGSATSTELLGLSLDTLLTVPSRLEALSLADVPARTARHLHPDNVIALLVAPAADFAEPLRARLPHATVNVVDFREGLGLNLRP